MLTPTRYVEVILNVAARYRASAVTNCRLTGQRVAAHYDCIVIVFAAPESRGELFFRAIARRAAATVVAVGVGAFYASAASLSATLPSAAIAGAPDAEALRAWTAPAPPPVILPAFGAPQGATFSVAGESADAIVLHFFASWCEPCREELPALKRLSERGAPRLKVVAVAVADNEGGLRRVIEATGVTFPVLMDRDRAVARAWSIAALPSTVILDSRHAPRLLAETDVAWDGIEPRQLLDRLSAAENNVHVQQPTKNQGRQ